MLQGLAGYYIIFILEKKGNNSLIITYDSINIFIIGCDIYLVGMDCELRVKYVLYFILLLVKACITAYMVAVQYFNLENILQCGYVKLT